jgi:transposase
MDDERLFHLSNEQWAQVEGAFPQRRGQSGFARKISNRLAFEGVLFRARTGIPWRDLPSAYGDHHTIYMRWQRWVKSGVPQRAMVAWYLQAAKEGKLDLGLALVDSTIVRAHQHAAGARKKTAATRRSGAAVAA